MRCLVVSPYYPPALGGACRMLGMIAGALCRSGHAVDVLTLAAPSEARFDDHDARDAPNVHRVRSSTLDRRCIGEMGAALARLAATRRHDVIFCGVAYPSGPLAYLVTRASRVPYVIYSHGEDATFIAGSPWKQPLMQRVLSRAAHVFANSGHTRDLLVRIGAPRERVEVHYPSIDPDPYLRATDAQAEQFRQSLGLSGKRLLLTVARLQRRKGHDTVVRALPAIAARIPEVHYLVVGKGDRAELDALARAHGVTDRVTIVDSLPDRELAVAYRACELLVLVSRADPSGEVEGFGMVYLEAGAAGRPSVAGNRGGAPEAVVHGETGLVVDPSSPEATAGAVVELLVDGERREAAGRAARERVVARFRDAPFLERIRIVCEQTADQGRISR